MPLTRDNITAASRIMLPLYVLLYLSVGLAFLLQAPGRTDGPAFEAPKSLLPIEAWGWLFFVVGAAELIALALRRRSLYQHALIVGAGLAAFWAVVIFASALSSPLVSYTSGMWVAGMAVAQAASARSLARYEISP